jgi:hypothetical protein
MADNESKKAGGGSAVLEEVFQNVRKVAEANLKMQQDILSQASSMWPGMPKPQSAWLSQMQQFRGKLVDTISVIARKHGEAVDRQYKAALESLDAALTVTDATTPEEFRRKSEQLCRKTLDCIREVTETQVRAFQDAITKWTDLLAKAGP